MRRRRFLYLGALLLAGLSIALLVPEVRYSIPGWLRGEPRYQGLPTSYWSRAIRDYHKAASAAPPSAALVRWVLSHIRLSSYPSVLGGGRDSIPVLIDLLGDKDPLVQLSAAEALGGMGSAAREAVPALRRLVETDPWCSDRAHDKHRAYLVMDLWRIDRQPEPAVSTLVGIVTNGNSSDVAVALCCLTQMGSDARSALPVLVDVLKEGNPNDSSFALAALGAMGPEARAAIPAILEVARRKGPGAPRGGLRFDLMRALESIDPETAAKVDPQLSGAAVKQATPATSPP